VFSNLQLTFTKNKPERIAVILLDEQLWHSALFERDEHGIHGIGGLGPKAKINAVNPDEIPEGLLNWALARKANSVCLLIPSDIVCLQIEIPKQALIEEKQSALQFELAALTGEFPETISVIACSNKENQSTGIWASYFHTNRINNWQNRCNAFKLHLCALGSLQILLCQTIAKSLETNFLLMQQQKTLLFMPTTQGIVIRNIPIGYSPDDRSAWAEMMSTRFEELNDNPLHIMVSHIDPHEVEKQIKNLFHSSNIKIELLERNIPKMMSIAAQRIPEETNATHCELLRFKKKNSHHIIFDGILAVALIFCLIALFLWRQQMVHQKQQLQQWSEIQEKCEEQLNKILLKKDQLEDEYEKQLSRNQFFENNHQVDPEFIMIFSLLERLMPSRVRISEMSKENNIIVIKGFAKDTPSLNRLSEGLFGSLNARGITANLQKINRDNNYAEHEFVVEITKSDGKKDKE